ncbi:hypothetical protein [Aquitalea pelogenes]|uniref:hypothetical protein n=1 Tax=Aquitalea pelogenes TaxID=1293573 RepID=UPI0035AF887E
MSEVNARYHKSEWNVLLVLCQCDAFEIMSAGQMSVAEELMQAMPIGQFPLVTQVPTVAAGAQNTQRSVCRPRQVGGNCAPCGFVLSAYAG